MLTEPDVYRHPAFLSYREPQPNTQQIPPYLQAKFAGTAAGGAPNGIGINSWSSMDHVVEERRQQPQQPSSSSSNGGPSSTAAAPSSSVRPSLSSSALPLLASSSANPGMTFQRCCEIKSRQNVEIFC